METYYREEKYRNEMSGKQLKDLNAHLPEWVKQFVELYTSDLKYEMKRKLQTE